jgi:hypothetical protein
MGCVCAIEKVAASASGTRAAALKDLKIREYMGMAFIQALL